MMDPNQDLLEALDRREGLHGPSLIAMVAGISLFAGVVAYFSLLNQNLGQELSLDGAGLFVVASAAGLVIAFRKLT
jgi:hypothetical protein